MRPLTAILVPALCLALAHTAFAWKGELAGGVVSIADVLAKAEAGDFLVVEGEVESYDDGDGSTMVVQFSDSTGTVAVVVPNFLLRNLAGETPEGGAGPEGIEPQVGARARVGGLWEEEPLEHTWHIRAQRVEPLGR
jgi:hypothetical protein